MAMQSTGAAGHLGLETPVKVTTSEPVAEPACPIEVSVVMPCLNEVETVGICVQKAWRGLQAAGVAGEVIVADNGSTDGSIDLATRCGARVVHVSERGYGSAVRGGIGVARGRFIIMADADDSYDFLALAPFVDRLRNGAHLVMGNRFRGGISPRAMPPLHRWIGNPGLSFLGRILFGAKCRDFHCGLRGFSREAALKMDLQSTGMEFATEMVAKASLLSLDVAELPVTLSPAGRTRPPHLRSFRDGVRHLSLMLSMGPRWLLAVPGCTLLISAIGGWLARLSGQTTGHDALVAGLCVGAAVLGSQFLLFAVTLPPLELYAQSRAPRARSDASSRWTLERALWIGSAVLCVGVALAAIGAMFSGLGSAMLAIAGAVAAISAQLVFTTLFRAMLLQRQR